MLQQLDTAIAFVVVMLMLSLLITAVVQAISALLDLRGRNLVRALADLFEQIDPSLREPHATSGMIESIKKRLLHPFSHVTLATKLADAVSTHPILAHTFTRAKAIRKDELLDVLKDLCSDNPNARIDDILRFKAKKILEKEVPGGAETVDAATMFAEKLAAQFPAIKDDLKNAVVTTMGKVSQLEAGVEKWFDTVMDRASDIFTRWTRTITVVVSVLFVVVLHIDAGLIVHQISTNPEIKAGLAKISDSVLAQADESLKGSDRASAALRQVAKNHNGDAIGTALSAAPDKLVTCAEGKLWLEAHKPSPNADMGQLQTEFASACQQQTADVLEKSEAQIGKLREDLTQTELKIVPHSIDGKLVFGGTDDTVGQRLRDWGSAYGYGRHLLGTLAMVVFLSLGAPFWYNSLEQLANLKPNITQKLEKESSTA